MAYQVGFSSAAERQFDDLSQDVRAQVVRHLEQVADDPLGRGVVKVKGTRSPVSYRCKVGEDYRVIYTIDRRQQVLTVTWVGLRRDAYRRR